MEKFSDYILLEKIATGGMADIFRAVKVGARGFRKYFVIKRILPHISEDKTVRDMFVKEAHTLASIEHSNIVQIHELGEENKQYYIVMDYIHGKDVRILLNSAAAAGYALSPELIFYVIYSVMKGLEYAHDIKDDSGQLLNIVHRDVNPNNIFLSFTGDVKIIDFGIVKSNFDNEKTQQGIIKGKIAYLSPEQLEGKNIDRRTDIFAVGILFYEMLSGKRLFQGKTETAILKSLVTQDINREIDQLDIDEDLASILRKLLDRDVLARYQSISEAKKDLLEILRKRNIQISHKPLQKALNDLFPDEVEAEKEKMARYNELITSGEYLQSLSPADDDLDKTVIYKDDTRLQKEPPPIDDEGTRVLGAELGADDDATRVLGAAQAEQATYDDDATRVLGLEEADEEATRVLNVSASDQSGVAAPVIPAKKKSMLPLVVGMVGLLAVAGGAGYYFLSLDKGGKTAPEMQQPVVERDVEMTPRQPAPVVAQPQVQPKVQPQLQPSVASQPEERTLPAKQQAPPQAPPVVEEKVAVPSAPPVETLAPVLAKPARRQRLPEPEPVVEPIPAPVATKMQPATEPAPEVVPPVQPQVGVEPTRETDAEPVVQQTAPPPQQLAMAMGVMKISGTPERQQLFVNGEAKGVLPLTLTLKPGFYELECRHELYKTYTAGVRLRKGKTIDFRCDLELKE